MSTCWDALKSVDAFVARCVGVERRLDADAICPGVDQSWAIGVCGKPGPHGRHRGDEKPPYRDA